MINIQDEYRGLLSGVLYGGTQKEDRTQIGTRSVFGRILRHNMATGFPLLTAKTPKPQNPDDLKYIIIFNLKYNFQLSSLVISSHRARIGKGLGPRCLALKYGRDYPNCGWLIP